MRNRLSSISWFMRCLNENIAKRANREDKCKGRFWEGRFKSIALIDQAAVLACLAYIDLNPIHAGIADTPENSDFTSGQERIKATVSKEKLECLRVEYQKRTEQKTKRDELKQAIDALKVTTVSSAWLSPIKEAPLDQLTTECHCFLNMDLKDYLQLLDWTGRQHRLDKKGKIPENLAPILDRLEIEKEAWLKTVKEFDNWFHHVAGTLQNMAQAAQRLGKKWLAGKTGAKIAFT